MSAYRFRLGASAPTDAEARHWFAWLLFAVAWERHHSGCPGGWS